MSVFEKYQLATAVWCEKFCDANNPAFSLRMSSLEPAVDIRDYNVSITAKKDEMDRLHRIRLSQTDNGNSSVAPLGRILCFYPDRSLGDALVHGASQGFFDEDDLPPWGTWFYFEQEPVDGENVLYCWVPVQFLQLVSDALAADCYDCLVWHS